MTAERVVVESRGRRRKTRPLKAEIPIKVVQDCLEAGLTKNEIACHLGVHHETLDRHIKRNPELGEMMESGIHRRRRALKLLQWAKCKQGNVAMLIHIGKAELGQGDNAVASGDTVRLVYTRPVLAPKEWEEQYGPMRGKPPREGD